MPGTAGTASGGGSGLIDIRSLTGGGGGARAASGPSDDILSIGGAGIGVPMGVPSLLQPERKEPSKLPYILGGVFGLVAIAAVAVVLVLVLGREKTDEVDVEALRAQIMKELRDQGMSKEQAEAAAEKRMEALSSEGEVKATEEGEQPAEGEGEEGAEGGSPTKKKGGGGKKKAGGGEAEEKGTTSAPVESSGGGKKSPSPAEDDLMSLLAGATKGGGKVPEKKEPAPEKKEPAPTPKASSDMPDKPTKQDVMNALNAVKPKVQSCGKGQTGVATVSINIAGSTGNVASAKVVSGPFKDTPQAGCIENAVKKAKFPKFKQSKFSVSYPFVIK
jgi:Sec-independent protein translocase protein TatA